LAGTNIPAYLALTPVTKKKKFYRFDFRSQRDICWAILEGEIWRPDIQTNDAQQNDICRMPRRNDFRRM